MQPAPTRDAGLSSRTWNVLPVVSTLYPAHRRATKALASVAPGPMIMTDNLSDAGYMLWPRSSGPSSQPSSIWEFLYSPTSGLQRLQRLSEPWMWAAQSSRAAHIHAAFMLVDAPPSRGLTRRLLRFLGGASVSGDWLVSLLL
jgi:hypothetical protein